MERLKKKYDSCMLSRKGVTLCLVIGIAITYFDITSDSFVIYEQAGSNNTVWAILLGVCLFLHPVGTCLRYVYIGMEKKRGFKETACKALRCLLMLEPIFATLSAHKRNTFSKKDTGWFFAFALVSVVFACLAFFAPLPFPQRQSWDWASSGNVTRGVHWPAAAPPRCVQLAGSSCGSQLLHASGGWSSTMPV